MASNLPQLREVWSYNLVQEFHLIRNIVDDYPYVAMDTEFPGTVVDNQDFSNDGRYKKVMENVNRLKLIQLGLTFFDEEGNLPTCETGRPCFWQFNFCEFTFGDEGAPESIDLLARSGINFQVFNDIGVNIVEFAELLMSSAAVLNDNMRWVTFHGMYDFGYLVKALTGRKFLPEDRGDFFELMNVFFPIVYDVKYMAWSTGISELQYCGLEILATRLGAPRLGVAHQAGSDSLLTSRTFMKLRQTYCHQSLDTYQGFLFSLNH